MRQRQPPVAAWLTEVEVRPTSIPEVLELVPVRHGDHRGWFSETANQRTLAEAGITLEWVQDNESFSAQKGSLRGIHFQLAPHAQHKLVRVISGSILDVAVDLRRSSATFGKHAAVTLTAEEGNQLLIPAGFGHAFCTLEPNCRVAYKVAGGYYAPESDRSIRWDDPALAIDWPATDGVSISAKDKAAPLFADTVDMFD